MFSARPACPNGDVLTFGCGNLQDQAELVENLKGAIQLRDDADQQRRDAESRLRHNQKIEALGHLAGGVAHDFNNTLTVVTGRAELLRAKNLTPSEGERHRVVDGAHPENTLYLPRSSSELLYCQEMPSFTSIPQSSRKRCSTSPSTHATACPRGGLGGAPTPRRSEF